MLDSYKILEIRELLGISQEDFARRIGYSREVVNKVEKGKMKPSKWFVQAVIKHLEKGQQTVFSQDVNILGKASEKPAPSLDLSYLETRRDAKNFVQASKVPLVAVKAQAGYMKGFEQIDFMDTLEQFSLPPGVNPMGAVWRYFEIDGDSMEPTLSAGDVVLATMVPAEDWKDIRDFSVYILHTDDQLLIKRLYKKSDEEWVLISDNEELYPQLAIPVTSVKQLWLFRRQIRARAPQPKEFKITA